MHGAIPLKKVRTGLDCLNFQKVQMYSYFCCRGTVQCVSPFVTPLLRWQLISVWQIKSRGGWSLPVFWNEIGVCRRSKGRSVTSSSADHAGIVLSAQISEADTGATSRVLMGNRTPVRGLTGGHNQSEPLFPSQPLFFLFYLYAIKKKLYIYFSISSSRLFTVATTIFHTLKTYSNFIFRSQEDSHSSTVQKGEENKGKRGHKTWKLNF